MPLVIADVGERLQWVRGEARFDLWKTELQPRLVPTDADRFRLEDFPGEHCYLATLWRSPRGLTCIVFEHHH